METPKMVVFVVKRYAVRNAKIERYAVRKGGGGCHPQTCAYWFLDFLAYNFEVNVYDLWSFISFVKLIHVRYVTLKALFCGQHDAICQNKR